MKEVKMAMELAMQIFTVFENVFISNLFERNKIDCFGIFQSPKTTE
ncbi:MAG: hypothetical protein GXO89_07225 [Chlorobi bacterium]|nr:hypothetical protein [Chlorobiota bacterium]